MRDSWLSQKRVRDTRQLILQKTKMSLKGYKEITDKETSSKHLK